MNCFHNLLILDVPTLVRFNSVMASPKILGCNNEMEVVVDVVLSMIMGVEVWVWLWLWVWLWIWVCTSCVYV